MPNSASVVASVLTRDQPIQPTPSPALPKTGPILPAPAEDRPFDCAAFLKAYPFLADRSTDRWFMEEYASLLPGPRPRPEAGPAFPAVDRKFVIGFTARVGSTLLCQHLFPYGVAVAEFLNPLHLRAGTHIHGAAGSHDLCNRLAATYAPNGALGLKAHVQSMIPFFLAGEFPERLADWRFVYLTRDNIVRQAISHVIAELRQSWSTWEEPKREVLDGDYSYDRIARTIWSTRLSQGSWEKFFHLFAIEPLRLTYETIVADPAAAAARVADHCGLERRGRERVAQFDDPPLSPQTTAVNAAWEQRFRHEASARNMTI